MTPKNESTFTMQPLNLDDGLKKPSFADPQTSDVGPGQMIQTHERGSLHQSFSARKLQVIFFTLGTGYVVLNWLVSVTSTSFFTNWAVIALTSFRFHSALHAQHLTLFAEPYTWSSTLWPVAPAVSLAISLLLLVCLLICAIAPVGATITASNFFSYTIGLLIIGIFTLGYKVAFKTKWVASTDADLVTGRRELSEQEMVKLREYYASPAWRRALSYFRL